MTTKENLVKKLSKKYNLDPRVVRLIADYPLKFARDKISNPENWRPVRLKYFGVFMPKAMGNQFYKNKVVDNEEGTGSKV